MAKPCGTNANQSEPEGRVVPPLFSILCATHNQAKFLGAMLDSVIAQTRTDFELVIVNDGSTDDTRIVLDNWLDANRVFGMKTRVLTTPQGGQSAAYEVGFASTTGDWICLLDSDDRFLPHKLETVAQIMASNSRAGFIQHPLIVIDSAGVPTGAIRPQSAALSSGDIRAQMKLNARHVSPGASGLVIRRDVFKQMVPFATKRFRFAADAYLSFGASSLTPVIAVPHPLAQYRMQAGGQYLRRMLSGSGLREQVDFQNTVASRFGLQAAAHRNSFFARNVYAAARFDRDPTWSFHWRNLLRATVSDAHFNRRRRILLCSFWFISGLVPRRTFEAIWRMFQVRQTGWNRIKARVESE